MPSRFLRRINRLAATGLGIANLPRPPQRPERIAGDWDYLKTRMRWFIRRGMRKTGVPGLSIALVDGQKLVWAEGFGYADRERRIPATAETTYQIGSITKVLNAIAMMQQVEAGRLDLDRPFRDYVPEFTMRTRWPDAAPITARALLCHHAGLPTYYLKGFFSDDSLETLLAQLKNEHFAYEPHTVFNYSNLGSNLLGLALARLTGFSYEEALTKNLLAPLGMTHTAFRAVSPTLARGYVYDRAADPTPIRDLPAGGLYSNVLDLARFMRFVFADGSLDGKPVLGASALRATFEPQYPDLPLDFGQRFGLGWMLSGLPVEGGGQQAWHNGGTKAFLSQMALLPERKLGVVVIANADCAGNLVYQAAEEALKLALEIRDGVVQPPKLLAPEIALPRETLSRYVGDYSLMGSLARITLGKKRLRLHVLNYVLDLVPVSPTHFRVEYNLLGLKSVPIPFPPIDFTEVNGRRFAILRDRVLVPSEKIPAYPIPETWRRYVGQHRLLNPDAEFLVDLEHCRMEIENGKLLMDIRITGIEKREVKVVMVPLNEHEAYAFGLGRNVGDVSHAFSENGRLRTRYSGYLFERIG